MICRSIFSWMSGFAVVSSSYKSTSTCVYLVCVCVCARASISEHACLTFASCVQGNLEQIQSVLNSTEVGLHQLTALVDCRSLHMVSHFVCCVREEKSSNLRLSEQPTPLFLSSQDYVQALTGLCYDGVEGLIYLVLFSFVTALMFSSIVCSVPHTWPGKRYAHTHKHTHSHSH